MSKLSHYFTIVNTKTRVFTPVNVNVSAYFPLGSAHGFPRSLETIIPPFLAALLRGAGSPDDLPHLIRPLSEIS